MYQMVILRFSIKGHIFLFNSRQNILILMALNDQIMNHSFVCMYSAYVWVTCIKKGERLR